MRYIIFVYFSILLFRLQAQENATSANTFHFKFGAGFGYQTLRDGAMSPLLYDGIALGAYAGADWRKPRSHWQVDGLFWLGQVSSERSGASADSYTFAINGSYLKQLHPGKMSKWQPSLGGALTTWGSFRSHASLVNSDFFYDLFFSLGPSGSMEHRFRMLHRDWILNWQLTVPIVTYGLRPNFSGLDEVPPDDNSFQGFKNAQFGSFNVLNNVKSKIELAYPLKNGNRIGLLYYWDFYQSNIKPHAVKQAMQSVQLNLHFSLSRTPVNANN